MVKQRQILQRLAFTMIELIFAIVIMSITIISLPMMTQVISKGIEDNLVQEAIFAASAELMGASAGYWDTNSMSDGDLSNLSRVIDVGPVICNNDNNSTRFRLRPGHITQPLHRRCIESNATTPADAASVNFPNLNNAAHPNQIMFTDNTTDPSGYKETYSSIVSVVRVNNIKFIDINVSDSSGDLKVVLRMQSANIGEIDYFKRRF